MTLFIVGSHAHIRTWSYPLQQLDLSVLVVIFVYLTIRLRARDFYEVIVDEGEARINYHLIEIESE